MRTSRYIKLPVEQTWQLFIDGTAQRSWLGPGAVLRPFKASRVQLFDGSGFWRSGVVTAVREKEIECQLAPASAWPSAQDSTRLVITLEQSANPERPNANKETGTLVTVHEAKLLADSEKTSPWDEADAFWAAALVRLKLLADAIRRRRGKPRQAVIIIHGIGEQEPGVTLRNFIDNAFPDRRASPGNHDDDGADNENVQSWSKPDRASRIFELRRITLKATDGQRRPATDIFELYWAHVIRDTTLSQVGAWLAHLMLRQRVPKRFRLAWWAAWLSIGTTLVATLARLLGWQPEWMDYALRGGIVILFLGATWRVLGQPFVVKSLGDAVRYLTPRPANIEHRQAIREAGVELLDTLHQRGSFDRIVILGHSLGSVIAYDIVSHYWIRVHRDHLRLPRVQFKKTAALEIGLEERDPEQAQVLQHEAWKETRSNSQPWLVTDLVTIGSPLSVADFLMARSTEEFKKAKQHRELPTCPPFHELKGRKGIKRVSYDSAYVDRMGGRDKQFTQFHHAAPFAVTRWTNLYFPSSLLRDPIGGPVAPLFGDWVRDVELDAPSGHRFFLHSQYWKRAGDNVHIDELLKALHLDAGGELCEELRKHSPLMYVPRDGS